MVIECKICEEPIRYHPSEPRYYQYVCDDCLTPDLEKALEELEKRLKHTRDEVLINRSVKALIEKVRKINNEN